MKLRIRENSVRIRLTRGEVARLRDGHRVEQATQFSSTSCLKSSIEPSTLVRSPSVEFAGTSISVLLPPDMVRRWADTEQVTIEAKQEVGPGASLQILVEKDFKCIHSRAEGDDDAFPNPREQHECAV